jgi:predicted alpha/beta-fold hydrolase
VGRFFRRWRSATDKPAGMLTRLDAISGALSGHFWTLRPFISRRGTSWSLARPLGSDRAEALGVVLPQAWSGDVPDARWGSVHVTGELHLPPGARGLVLVVHGLGGSSDSLYVSSVLPAAAALGLACLRLNLRGADGSGEDFYHAALTADLHAALASPMLAGFSDIYVLGYSLGGHLTLCFAAEPRDARVRAVAAVCSPIDLARSAWAIDQPGRAPYRHYVLRKLKGCYAQVARRRPLPTPVESVLSVRTIRQWDSCAIVPRYGFASTDDYYARASVAPRLRELGIAALLVNTEHDPMIPAATVRPALVGGTPRLDVRWLRAGGHVGFPYDVDLGEKAPRGLEPQILHWLTNAASPA